MIKSFSTTEEIWRYVLGGGRVYSDGSDPDEYVESIDGVMRDETGVEVSYSFAYPGEWHPWEPPKALTDHEAWTLIMSRGGEISLEGLYESEESARVALASKGRDRENLLAIARVIYSA